MGDLASLHAQARRLIVALRSGLDRLEAQEGVNYHALCMCNPAQCICSIDAACVLGAANVHGTSISA
jgi:hypothetical protein